jgi:hypothetical protein
MVAPAKAPPSLLAEAKKIAGTGRPSSHALHLTRNVKSEREELLGRSRGLYGQMDWWEGGRNRGHPAIPSRHTAVTAGNVTKRNAEIGYASVVPGVSWYRVSCIVVSWSGQTLKRKGAGPTTRCGDCATPKLTSISASTPSSGPPRPIPASPSSPWPSHNHNEECSPAIAA